MRRRKRSEAPVETVGGGGGEEPDRGVRPGAVADDGDVLRVAAETGDVLLHPLERGDDVLEAEVGGVRKHAPVLGEREPAERAEPVVQGHPDGAAARGET
jgi:hypothetical protein